MEQEDNIEMFNRWDFKESYCELKQYNIINIISTYGFTDPNELDKALKENMKDNKYYKAYQKEKEITKEELNPYIEKCKRLIKKLNKLRKRRRKL